MSVISAIFRSRKFFIASSEYPLPCVLYAARKRRMKCGKRKDFVLVDVDPPISASMFEGKEARVTGDIRQLILAARFAGCSLSPITDWPCYVHVLVPCFDTCGAHEFKMQDVYHWIWAELYTTREAAEQGNRNENGAVVTAMPQ